MKREVFVKAVGEFFNLREELRRELGFREIPAPEGFMPRRIFKFFYELILFFWYARGVESRLNALDLKFLNENCTYYSELKRRTFHPLGLKLGSVYLKEEWLPAFKGWLDFAIGGLKSYLNFGYFGLGLAAALSFALFSLPAPGLFGLPSVRGVIKDLILVLLMLLIFLL